MIMLIRKVFLAGRALTVGSKALICRNHKQLTQKGRHSERKQHGEVGSWL